MADWILIDGDDKLNSGGFNQNNFNFRHAFVDLENFDLPPPLNVYEGLEKTIVLPPLNEYKGSEKTIVVPPRPLGCDEKKEGRDGVGGGGGGGGGGSEGKLKEEKWEISNALRLSQSRARVAEMKVKILSKELNCISKILIQESMELFAYKQWLKLMEFQVAKLQKQPNGVSQSVAWFLALRFCLGFAAGFGITMCLC